MARLFALQLVALTSAVVEGGFSATPSAHIKAAGSSAAVLSHTNVLKDYDFHWSLDVTSNKIYVALVVSTTGWVGLGLGEAGGMRGADIMIGSVHDTTGTATVSDYHAVANAVPVKDGCQDWTLHHGEQADGKTLIIASRKFITGDANDRPIIRTGLRKQSLLFAYGSCDAVTDACFHGANKRKMFIDLSTGHGADKQHFVSRLEATAGYSYVDLFFNAASYNSNIAGRHESFKQPDAGGKELLHSSTRTMYWEYCFARSAHPEWSAHDGKRLVGFNGILDTGATRADLVHHSVLYAYDGDDCGGISTVIWVGGNGFYEELPADVGMSFSRFKSFRVQVHYDNPLLESGLEDNSGVRMWLDAKARTHEAGTIQLGDPSVSMSRSGRKTIPPGKSYWEFKCPSAATASWHEITVFGQILHMHATGDQMYLQIKDGNGQVRRPNFVEYFDFGWQDPTLGETFKITPGDELTTRCYFNNKGSKSIPFGLGSDEEMCIDFIYYYPYLPSNGNNLYSTHQCGHGENGGEFVKTAIVNDNGIAVFGTNPDNRASCQRATQTPTPTPPHTPTHTTHKTTFTSGLGGFTKEGFNAAAQAAYKSVLATSIGSPVSARDIAISNIATASARRRQLLAAGVTFNIAVSVASAATANAVVSFSEELKGGGNTVTFKNSLKTAFIAAAGVAFDSTGFDSFDISIVTRKGTVICVAETGCGGSKTNIVGVAIGSATGAIFGLIGLAAYLAKKRKQEQKQSEIVPSPAGAPAAAAVSDGKSVDV